MSGKQHMSVVVCGHVDSGKSTTTGHLLFELGKIDSREMEKLKTEAEQCGMGSFTFAFCMDKTKEERARGITIICTTKEFFTPNYHYTIIDAPGHRDFIKNMLSGAAQADIAILMVPGDGNFTTSLAKGDHKTGEVKGQTREHARLINLLGVKQLIVAINKMDSDVAGYKQERYNEIRDEVKQVLVRVGWNKKFVDESVPIIPISGWVGDNLFKKSDKMTWWNGQKVKATDGSEITVTTLHDCLNEYAKYPQRPADKPLRMPVSGVHNIRGVGDVITGKIEQGSVKPGAEVIFLPSHTAANTCAGKVFSIEMHHKSIGEAMCGDNVGLCIRGLNKDYKPQVGDIMILKADKSLGPVKRFTVQVQVLDHPGELKVGYTPIVHCRTAKAPCKLVQLQWKMGRETGNAKLENPQAIKANEMGCLVFEVNPKHPIVVDAFQNTEVLGRIAIMEGNAAIMLGKVTHVEKA